MVLEKERGSSSYGLQVPEEASSSSPLLLPGHPDAGRPLSSQPKTFANVFIAIVGAGVLGLPYAFKRTGWAAGALMLFVVAALTYHCMMLLVRTRRKLELDAGFSKIASFGDLGLAVSGPAGRLAVDAMIVISQAGFCVSYLIFIANTLAHLYNGDGDGGGDDSSASFSSSGGLLLSGAGRLLLGLQPKALYIWGMLPFQLGLNSIKTLTHLAPLSIFADVVDIGAMGVVMVEDVALYLQRQPPLQAFGGLSVVFYGLGVAVYAFEGIGMVLPLESEAADKARVGRTLGISMALISIMYALFGVLGYFAFGDDTRDIITTNLGKGVLTELVQVLPDLSVDATQLYMVSVAVALQEIGYDIHIEMHKEGDILLRGDLVDPTSGHLYQMLKRVGQLFGLLKSSLEDSNDECIILRALLQDKVSKVIKVLSESHWTSSFIVTMKKFQSICKESDGSAIILSYLIQCKKAHYLSIRKSDFVEGVKVSLVAAPVSNLLSLDFDMLHLIWTIEKLQQQLDMIDQRWDMKRKLALSSLKCGKKQVAYMYLRQAKLLSEGRGKCAFLLDRVEEVFSTITHSESTKKVAEAIQIGAQAIKDNQISVEEVRSCLEELPFHGLI